MWLPRASALDHAVHENIDETKRDWLPIRGNLRIENTKKRTQQVIGYDVTADVARLRGKSGRMPCSCKRRCTFDGGYLIPEDDRYVNPLAVKGVGEIGITGTVGAIANAVWATAKRKRRFPVRLEDLL